MYAKINIKNQSIAVFVNWEDYEMYRKGVTLVTRYDSERKIEIVPVDILNNDFTVSIQQLGNEDVIVNFPFEAANNQFVVSDTIRAKHIGEEKKMRVKIFWPSQETSDGYAPRRQYHN